MGDRDCLGVGVIAELVYMWIRVFTCKRFAVYHAAVE